MNIVIFITLLLILLIIYNYWEHLDSEVTYQLSDVDRRRYIVLKLPDSKAAADQLALLRIKLEDFVNYIYQKEHSSRTQDRGPNLDDRVILLKERFRAVISESKPGSKFTSYTVNKGDKIYMCLRERDEHNRLVDENTLFFVALHELSHVMTKSVGHTSEFWDNFRYLLRHAISAGYYRYQPYHEIPKKYCGTYIEDSPLKGK